MAGDQEDELNRLVESIEKEIVDRVRGRRDLQFKGFYEHQREALKRLIREFKAKGVLQGIVQMPTGSGKTLVAAALALALRRLGKRYRRGNKPMVAVFLAPRQVIRSQAVGLFMSLMSAYECRSSEEFCENLYMCTGFCVLVLTPQLLFHTLPHTRPRCLKDLEDSVLLVILDEAHTYYTGEKTMEPLKEFIGTRSFSVVGFTATPVWDAIETIGPLIYTMSSREAMQRGVISKLRRIIYYRTLIRDLKIVDTAWLEGGNVEWRVAIKQRAEKYAEVIAEHLAKLSSETGGRKPKTLVVSPNTSEAEILRTELKKRLNNLWVKAAHYKVEEAAEVIEEFKSRSSGVLVTVNMASIGFDDPDLEVLVIARPITSPVAYTQLCGRVLRKPHNTNNLKTLRGAVIIDLVGETVTNQLEDKVERVELGRFAKQTSTRQ